MAKIVQGSGKSDGEVYTWDYEQVDLADVDSLDAGEVVKAINQYRNTLARTEAARKIREAQNKDARETKSYAQALVKAIESGDQAAVAEIVAKMKE